MKKKYLDGRFLFVGPGYNLRPTDVQAAIAGNQFKRLNKFIKIRNTNREKLIKTFVSHKNWNNQFYFIKPAKTIKASWFGLPILINNKDYKKKVLFLKYLSKKGIENRPIISGNFLNQPALKQLNLKQKAEQFKNAQLIEKQGFFIGLHTKLMSQKEANFIVSTFLNFKIF